MYNLTNVTNANNLFDIVVAVNQTGSGVFGGFILLIIFAVCFVMFRTTDNLSGMLYASYVTSVLAILFFWAGFIGLDFFMIPVCLTAVLLFIKVIGNN